MYIARILYPVKVLGPGNRIGIWFNGCIHHCKGCSNPELWKTQERYKVSKEIRIILDEDGTLNGMTFEEGNILLVKYRGEITEIGGVYQISNVDSIDKF